MLWFDVEKRYNTTLNKYIMPLDLLWFDVEKRYNTTQLPRHQRPILLWFDVEKRYNTTYEVSLKFTKGCGLM